jgi:hypothetical protein
MLNLCNDGIGLLYVILLPVKLPQVLLQIRYHLLAPIDLSECTHQVLDVEVAPPELLDLVAKHIHEVECRG